MINDKAQIFNNNKLRTKIISVSEWGELKLKELSAGDQQEFEKLLQNTNDELHYMCFLIIKSIVKEDDTSLFDNDDIENLKAMKAAPLLQIFKAILELNKIGDNEVKEASKNS